MNVIIINGVTLPCPDVLEVTPNNIHSEASGRSQSGYMALEMIRSDVITLKLGWSLTTADVCKTIVSATAPSTFSVTYFDCEIVTKTFYVGNRTRNVIRVNENNPDKSLYATTLTLVEC